MTLMTTSYPPSAIARAFSVVTRFEIADRELAVIFDAAAPRAAVIELDLTKDERGNERHRVLALLDISRKQTIGDNALAVTAFWQDDAYIAQVEGICVATERRDLKIAIRLYEALIKIAGVTLLSDNEQYQGGQAIWKKLAREDNGISVFVMDTDTGKFYPFDGERFEYNGTNIPDDQIWSEHPDKSKWQIVLVAESRAAVA